MFQDNADELSSTERDWRNLDARDCNNDNEPVIKRKEMALRTFPLLRSLLHLILKSKQGSGLEGPEVLYTGKNWN